MTWIRRRWRRNGCGIGWPPSRSGFVPHGSDWLPSRSRAGGARPGGHTGMATRARTSTARAADPVVRSGGQETVAAGTSSGPAPSQRGRTPADLRSPRSVRDHMTSEGSALPVAEVTVLAETRGLSLVAALPGLSSVSRRLLRRRGRTSPAPGPVTARAAAVWFRASAKRCYDASVRHYDDMTSARQPVKEIRPGREAATR